MLRTANQSPFSLRSGMLLTGMLALTISAGCTSEADTNVELSGEEQQNAQPGSASTAAQDTGEDDGAPQRTGDGNAGTESTASGEAAETPEGLADPELRLILGVDPLPAPVVDDLLRPADLPLVFGIESDVEEAPFRGSTEARYNALRLRPSGSDRYGVALELFMMRNTRDARLRFDALRQGSLGSIQRVDVGTEGFVNEGPGLMRIHVLDYATRTIFMISCSSEERCNAAQLMRQASIVLDRLRVEHASN